MLSYYLLQYLYFYDITWVFKFNIVLKEEYCKNLEEKNDDSKDVASSLLSLENLKSIFNLNMVT